MVRWEPGAQERLQTAALELYARQGFEQTTAADVAQAAGLTERTFFRYFADKREVLFVGQEQFQQVFLDGLATAPADASALDAVACALQGAAVYFPEERREHARRRQPIIAAHPGLHERELLKMAALAESIADALRARGVGEPQATLAAQTGVTVFRVAFREWIAEGEQRCLAAIEAAVFDEVRALSLDVR